MWEYGEKNKDTWCVNAFHGLLGMNDGVIKPCCMYAMDLPTEKYPVIGKAPIEQQYMFGEFMEMRDSLSNGVKHKACRRCWQEEDAGKESKRLRDNKVYFNSGIKFRPATVAKMELNLGNTCNIKCRTCSPGTSSQWIKEDFDINWAHKKHYDYKTWLIDNKADRFYKHYSDDSPFWQDIENNLPNIKQFDFYGGEPFMSKKMWKLINTARDKGYSKNIELHYNTNGTLWPEEELRCWEDFEHVSLSFSVDGIGDKFEFMRHPAKWDTLIEHYHKAEKMRDDFGNMSMDWCVTLSSLNVYYLPEILEFFYEHISKPPRYETGLYLNLVHGPEYYNIQYLPNEIKTVVDGRLHKLKQQSWLPDSSANQVDGIMNFMKTEKYTDTWWRIFKSKIDVHDDYRKENYYETFPEMGELIKAK